MSKQVSLQVRTTEKRRNNLKMLGSRFSMSYEGLIMMLLRENYEKLTKDAHTKAIIDNILSAD